MRFDVSDAELVAALIEGRPAAYRTMWERFSPLVGGVLRRALGSDELEDVQQEVFSCIFRRMATLRDPLALRPFVIAITLNTVKYERRRRRRRARVALIPDPAQLSLTGRDQPASNLAFARFTRLIRQLAERDRTTFVYRFIDGMTLSQIAEAMSISEPTARRSFSRAWARMQKWAARDPFLNDYLHRRRLGFVEAEQSSHEAEESSREAEESSRDDEPESAPASHVSPVSLAGYPPLPEISLRFAPAATGTQAVHLTALSNSYGV